MTRRERDKLRHFHRMASQYLSRVPDYPECKYGGQGIVTCGGGREYFIGAWILVTVLQELKCKMPIQYFYRGTTEMSTPMLKALRSRGVECIDCKATLRDYPNFAVKPYAIINSRFQNVLFIDADNLPMRSPEFLLSSQPFTDYGSLVWPDILPLEKDNGIWQAFRVTRQWSHAMESGQMCIDKSRHWKPLNLALHYNQHHKFYYPFTKGDKDTFLMAWKRLDWPYAMVPHLPIWAPTVGLIQHDLDGRTLFEHRAGRSKWLMPWEVDDQVYHADLCRGAIEEINHMMGWSELTHKKKLMTHGYRGYQDTPSSVKCVETSG